MTVRRAAVLGYLVLLCTTVACLGHAFAVTGKLATLGDDSASYLAWANYFVRLSDPGPWLKLAAVDSHFPPFFPIVLAVFGAGDDLTRAQQLVLGIFVLALPLMVWYARAVGLRAEAGLLLASLFCLLPWSWLRLMGVLSESLFLTLSLLALIAIRRGDHGWLPWLQGVLLACTLLTRSIGVALILAVVVHEAWKLQQHRDWRRSLQRLGPVLALPLLLLLGWYRLRPGGSVDAYTTMLSWHNLTPGALLQAAAQLLAAWQEQFAMFPGLSVVNDAIISIFGVVCLAGLVWRCRDNQVDGWFVAISLAIIWIWTTAAPQQGPRLLFPLMPFLLLFALLLCERVLTATPRYLKWLICFAPVAVIALLADQLILHRTQNQQRIFPGWTFAMSLDYYLAFDEEAAKADARTNVSTLFAFEQIAKYLPGDAVVMWTQPKYIALFAHRSPAMQYARWSTPQLMAAVHASGTTHILYSRATKSDPHGYSVHPFRVNELADIVGNTMIIQVPHNGEVDAWVVEIDRQRLSQRLNEAK